MTRPNDNIQVSIGPEASVFDVLLVTYFTFLYFGFVNIQEKKRPLNKNN